MPYYAQIDSNGIAYAVSELSGEVIADNLIPLASMDSAVLGKRWVGGVWEDVPAEETPVALSQLAFLRRFTAPERVAIRASANPYVVDFMDLLNKATEVLQSDPEVQGGMAYLVSLGLLSQARADEILAW